VEIRSASDLSAAALDHIRIVLVGTTHPGNIGATARAMKVMGLRHLYLVAPLRFPAAEATALAAGADDILALAQVHETLANALAGCEVIYGTTARERRINWPTLEPRAAALDIANNRQVTALVFGRERSGLSNEELDLCQHAISIETNPHYRSLNLAQAVQICAYELRIAHHSSAPTSAERRRDQLDLLAGAEALERLRSHCLTVMQRVGYLDPQRPKLLDRRLRRLFNRAAMRHSEVQIVRGLLSAIEARLDNIEGGE
jgi:TrmH family RNA methyltransferase